MLADPEGALTDVLLYHVVPGKVMAADVLGLDGQMVETVGGGTLEVTVDGDSVMINGIEVVAADVETSNGVIHVIGGVLVPEAGDEMAEGEMAEDHGDMADIVDTAVAAGDFGTLVAAVTAAGLVDMLKGEGPFTVFAPADSAFAALPEGAVDGLLADPEGALTDVLLYHVVPGKVMAADVLSLDGQMVETVGGGMLEVTVDGNTVMINGIPVVAADVETSNGVIHVIEGVLLPAAEEEMAEGEGEMMEDHGDMSDIVDTAVAAGDFETLVAAVTAAGLVDTLKGEGPFTVFAPADSAFAALPEGAVDGLLADPEGALTDVLLYHVVAGKVMAADVLGLDGQMVETVGGGMLEVTVDGDTVLINGIPVAAADIETSNGVIHVIDGVLLP